MNKVGKMYRLLNMAAMVVLCACSCGDATHNDEGEETKETKVVLPERKAANSVYHWKTVFDPSEEEWDFMKRHDVKRLYVKMFDVVYSWGGYNECSYNTPTATTIFKQKPKDDVNIVPVVYITYEALCKMKKKEQVFAEKIVTRVLNMMSYNELGEMKEMQLDCDWTKNTQECYFELCRCVRKLLNNKGIALSATIRLHQLRDDAPPVDRGMLMLYNTGSLKDFETKNSILEYKDVKPYLKTSSYGVELDFVYPAFSWNVWFCKDEWDRYYFNALIAEMDFSNDKIFKRISENKYKLLQEHESGNNVFRKSDIIRHEEVESADILKVKKAVESKLKRKNYSVAIYHLSSKELSKFTENEINEIYKAD